MKNVGALESAPIANSENISLSLAPILVSFFTVSEEFLQKLSPNRTFDLVDLASDFRGIVLFTWLAERQKNLLEYFSIFVL